MLEGAVSATAPFSNYRANFISESISRVLYLSRGGNHPVSYTHLAEGKRYLDQWFHSRFIGASNFTGYNNPEFDKLIDQAEIIASPEKRREMYIKAHHLIQEDAPWLFLFHPVFYMARQPYVKGCLLYTSRCV